MLDEKPPLAPICIDDNSVASLVRAMLTADDEQTWNGMDLGLNGACQLTVAYR